MPGQRKGYTATHRCATVKGSKRNQPSNRDRKARHKLQEKALGFHTSFYGPAYRSIGPEVKKPYITLSTLIDPSLYI